MVNFAEKPENQSGFIEGYSADWAEKAPAASARQWSREYSKAFRASRKAFGWNPLKPGDQVEIPLYQRKVLQFTSRYKTFMDVGCGNGYVVALLRMMGKEAYGIDCAEEAIDFCRDHFGGRMSQYYRLAAIEELPNNQKQYDAVLCLELLEHLTDPELALKLLWDRVAPDGILVVTVPVAGQVPSPYHLQEFTPERLKELGATIEDNRAPFGVKALGEGRQLLAIEKKTMRILYHQVYRNEDEAIQAGQSRENGTGFFNWLEIHHGRPIKAAEVETGIKSDVLHVHLNGSTFDLPRELRRKLGAGGPKLVVQIDYALEWWGMFPPYQGLLKEQLLAADAVWVAEPLAAAMVKHYTGIEAHVMPNPCPVKELKQLKVETSRAVRVPYHRDVNVAGPYFAHLGTARPIELIGYPRQSYMPGAQIDWPILMYDRVVGRLEWAEWIGELAAAWALIEPYHHHVAGRTTMEAAALGVPCIGFESVSAQQVCFPSLTCKTGDWDTVRHRLSDLEWSDNYKAAVELAQERVEVYSFASCEERFFQALGQVG